MKVQKNRKKLVIQQQKLLFFPLRKIFHENSRSPWRPTIVLVLIDREESFDAIVIAFWMETPVIQINLHDRVECFSREEQRCKWLTSERLVELLITNRTVIISLRANTRTSRRYTCLCAHCTCTLMFYSWETPGPDTRAYNRRLPITKIVCT